MAELSDVVDELTDKPKVLATTVLIVVSVVTLVVVGRVLEIVVVPDSKVSTIVSVEGKTVVVDVVVVVKNEVVVPKIVV